jgi:hypothetical protein
VWRSRYWVAHAIELLPEPRKSHIGQDGEGENALTALIKVRGSVSVDEESKQALAHTTIETTPLDDRLWRVEMESDPGQVAWEEGDAPLRPHYGLKTQWTFKRIGEPVLSVAGQVRIVPEFVWGRPARAVLSRIGFACWFAAP